MAKPMFGRAIGSAAAIPCPADATRWAEIACRAEGYVVISGIHLTPRATFRPAFPGSSSPSRVVST